MSANGTIRFPRGAHIAQRLLHQYRGQALSGGGVIESRVADNALVVAVAVRGEA
jgi:hypothetical protein